jgi:hypothetical protein
MPTPPKTVQVYVARRRLKMGPDTYREPEERRTGQEGQLVPEAHLWVRHESWLHTGYLRLKEVTVAELDAAFAEFAVPAADQAEIRRVLGLSRRRRPVPPAPVAPADPTPALLAGPVPTRELEPTHAPAPRSAAPAALDPQVSKERPAERAVERLSGGHPSTAIITPMRALDDEPAPETDGDVDLTAESVL